MLAIITALGFAGRSIAGCLLFWVSYLELPYGRSLQLGGGLWFFGLDAVLYYGPAKTAALQGLLPVFNISAFVPSVVYVKAIGLFLWLFGDATSTALMLNLATYLGTCAIITVWAGRRGVDRRIATLTVAALSFMPSSILWALQPLKDGFVLFLAVLFAFTLDELVAACRGPVAGRRLVRASVAAAGLALAIYAMAGIRWYYALIMLVAASIPMVAIVARAQGPRALAVRGAFTIALMFALVQQAVAGAGPYMPPGVLGILRPWTARGEFLARVEGVGAVIQGSRENFDRYTDGKTRIRAGKATTRPAPAAVSLQKRHSPTPASVSVVAKGPGAETATTATTPALKPAATPPKPAAKTAAKRRAKPASKPAAKSAATRPDTPAPAAATASTAVSSDASAGPASKPPMIAAPASTPGPTATPAGAAVPTRAVARQAPAPSPAAAAPQVSRPPVDVPVTKAGRLTAGLAALLLPRKVASALGLVSIGGGRGLMWFADVDTLVFNALMIACTVLFVSGMRRGAWRDPMVWYLVIATACIATALAYTVSNYGTLFRHRQMVAATLVLIGFAASRPRPDAVDVHGRA